MYSVIKAQRTNPKYEGYSDFSNKDFLIVIKRNNDNQVATLYCYSLDEESSLYKVSGIKNFRCPAVENKVALRKLLYTEILNSLPYWSGQFMYMAPNEDNWKLTDILFCAPEKDFLKYVSENNIAIFKPYVINTETKLNFITKNDSVLSDIEVIELLDGISIKRIESVGVLEDYAFACLTIKLLNDDRDYSSSNDIKGIVLVDDDYEKWKKETFTDRNPRMYMALPFFSQTSIEKFFVSCPDEKTLKITKAHILIEKENNDIFITVSNTYSYCYEIGKPVVCTKHMKTKNKTVSPLDMFNINSQNIKNPYFATVFNDGDSIYEFYINNIAFFEKCGFKTLIKNLRSGYNLMAIFVLYFSLIYEYPVIELLVKMGHANLMEGIIRQLFSSARKEEIRENVKELEQLINNDTAKGSAALRFPSYIGDYLKNKNAKMDEYLFWRDIYEITNISKENFEKFINMNETHLMSLELSEEKVLYGYDSLYTLGLQEIVKYPGYSLEKTIKYCFKKHLEKMSQTTVNYYHSYRFVNTFTLLKDTLLMAEELDFDLEKFPENLEQIHNQLANIHRNKASEKAEKVTTDISNECTELINTAFESKTVDLPTKGMELYSFIFPKTLQEFTEEGQKQHNCVAGYFNKVVNGDCIIFFVREKKSLNDSFITAEIRKHGIGQVMYSNNRPVDRNNDAYKYCSFIARKVLAAVSKNEIKALDKISK